MSFSKSSYFSGHAKVLSVNDNLPIQHVGNVHSGKVRSVYWLSAEQSQRLIKQHHYPLRPDTLLAVMVISDRISAFDCIWQGEDGLAGIPGKGAALNSIAHHWFDCFAQQGLANSHIVDMPHPLVWIVQQAQPVKIEAIARRYITGSMWRAYAHGERQFCGEALPDGLHNNQRLASLLITPSTKGIVPGLMGVPETDDVNVSRGDIERHFSAFGFQSLDDIAIYETYLREGFRLIETELAKLGHIFVDTKFEFGYVQNLEGVPELIYMDEVGTPDSSRLWETEAYAKGQTIEHSKEGFRQFLLQHFPDPDILLNKNRMAERQALAAHNAIPNHAMYALADTYKHMAETITGKALVRSDDPVAEIIDVLNGRYGLIE